MVATILNLSGPGCNDNEEVILHLSDLWSGSLTTVTQPPVLLFRAPFCMGQLFNGREHNVVEVQQMRMETAQSLSDVTKKMKTQRQFRGIKYIYTTAPVYTHPYHLAYSYMDLYVPTPTYTHPYIYLLNLSHDQKVTQDQFLSAI